jgi:beta-lactamase superfamily II metal-dependent hydrolase
VETLQALAGIPLLRTDLNGSVELVTDGEQLWVSAEK